jgi:hypothetical protein
MKTNWLFILLFVTFLANIGLWGNYYVESKLSNNLVETSGVVVEAEVASKSDLKLGLLYAPRIVYRYLAGGVEQRGEKYSIYTDRPWWTGSRASSEILVSRYPVGGKIVVWYDKRNPSFSRLANVGPSVLPPITSSVILFVFLRMLMRRLLGKGNSRLRR